MEQIPEYIRADGPKGTLLFLRVLPGARKNEVEGPHGAALKVRIKAPPVDGKANNELLKFLAKTLGIRARDLEIVRGTKGRDKTIRIADLGPERVGKTLLKGLNSKVT